MGTCNQNNKNSKIRVLSDFDGVYTDTTKQADKVRQASIQEIAELTYKSKREIEKAYSEAEKTLLEEPNRYGWLSSNTITAFCNEDKFTLATSVISYLAQNFRLSNNGDKRTLGDLIKKSEVRTIARFADRCFDKGRQQAGQEMNKDETRLVIDTLKEDYDLFIMANRDVRDLREKLRSCTINMPNNRVIGDAYKFRINPRFKIEDKKQEYTHESMTFSIDMRRQRYNEILETVKPDVVIGDVFSLDLALPLYKGSQAVLKVNSYTPGWAIEAVKSHPNGYTVEDYKQIPTLLKSL